MRSSSNDLSKNATKHRSNKHHTIDLLMYSRIVQVIEAILKFGLYILTAFSETTAIPDRRPLYEEKTR